jgi:hypothetical protein
MKAQGWLLSTTRQRKEMIPMADFHMPHSGHERHLCFLHNVGHVKEKLEEYKKLVKDGKYVCKGCGRVAVDEKHLCAPEKL